MSNSSSESTKFKMVVVGGEYTMYLLNLEIAVIYCSSTIIDNKVYMDILKKIKIKIWDLKGFVFY